MLVALLYVCDSSFIHLWLHWVFIAVSGPSLVAASGGYLLLAVPGLLTAGASLVVEHWL